MISASWEGLGGSAALEKGSEPGIIKRPNTMMHYPAFCTTLGSKPNCDANFMGLCCLNLDVVEQFPSEMQLQQLVRVGIALYRANCEI